ncbi:long-chain fatty acid--CoA ligase [Streptomyces sp. SID14515]|uniref:acyl-CoA synthetase n=1 Tax=Streptomyces sp. SID14515 TaxID=2706074 RepID=UPI0013C687EF|nr:long-chain fatty acid--CoA ligase [Streptomyces sp. SID14515]NEB41540.1 long-chain fatty acid--CoA ligase [Streptomyces sp. SID14515]
MNLGRYVRRTSRHHPEAEAVVCGRTRLTYAALDEDADRLATALGALGLRKGDCVATLSANRAELVVAEVALYKAALVRAPINARLGTDEVAHLLRESAARVLLVDSGHLAAAAEAMPGSGVEAVICFDRRPEAGADDSADGTGRSRPAMPPTPTPAPAAVPVLRYEEVLRTAPAGAVDVDCAADDSAVLHFTSGSTGRLKAAIQTYGNRLALMRKMVMGPDTRVGPGDRQILAGPITHASGMPLMGIFFAGGCAVVLERWDAETFLATVERERATHAFLVPTMVNTVLALPNARDHDVSSLRQLIYGAAPMSPRRIREAWDLFGPVLSQGYGCGETTSGVMFLSTEDHRRGIEGQDEELLLSCGRPTGEAEVDIVDDRGRPVPDGEIGEITVRGPDVVPGYLDEPRLTADTFVDGWFRTGDLARRRSDGYVFIVDRRKDMIISGGFNIYAVEVEAALHQHPDVFEAAVVGVPDEQWGEAVKAVVVPRPGARLDEETLVEFCARRLARMKKPRSVDFVAALPHNPNGKVDRRALRAPYWAGAERRVH